MDAARWIDRCAGQLGRRWLTIDPSQAWEIAARLSQNRESDESRLSQNGESDELTPEYCADAHVRQVEEARHVEPSAFVLTFRCNGATDEQRTLASAAAEAIFREAGITPAGAARAWWERDGWDTGSYDADTPPLTDDESRAATAWDRAEDAAKKACLGPLQEHQLTGVGLDLLWRWEPENSG